MLKEARHINDYFFVDAEARELIKKEAENRNDEDFKIQMQIDSNLRKINTLYINNVESMKNDDTLIAGDVIKTLGYYEVCDGGSGLYVITNECPDEVADGIEYIALQNELFARLMIEENTIKVKQMGVKENESIKNAVDYCTAKGLNLYLNGSKFITEHFELYYDLIGNNTEIEFTGDTGMSIMGNGLTLEGITLNQNHLQGNTLYISNSCKDVIVRRCTFINAGYEAISTGYRIQENILITECVFKDYGRCAIGIVGVDGINIINNTFYDGLEGSSFCIDIEPFEDGMTCKNITIENNRLIHSQIGIGCYAYPGVTYGVVNISNNLIEAKYGIKYGGSFSTYETMLTFNVSNNTFNCTDNAILVTHFDSLTVDTSRTFKCTNNHFEKGAIVIQGQGVMFNDNYVYHKSHITIGCARCSINGNYLDIGAHYFVLDGRNYYVNGTVTNNVWMGAPALYYDTQKVAGTTLISANNLPSL